MVYDPTTQLSDEVLQVYELHVRKYERRADSQLPGVELGLRMWEGAYEGKQALWLRWCDESGALILTGAERANSEAERANSEAERANSEAERAERLAAKLRELSVDPNQL